MTACSEGSSLDTLKTRLKGRLVFMSIFKLEKEKHGFQGYRVLVQIGTTCHRKYFSTAGVTKSEERKIKREAEQLNNELLEKKEAYQSTQATRSHWHATKGRELGLTGIQITFSTKKGVSLPCFRILVDHSPQRPVFRYVSIVSRGLDAAWEEALGIWAETTNLSREEIDRVRHENKPTLDHFENLAGSIFEYGHDINVESWIKAGIA